MNNFEYCAPTKVVFGRGVESQTGALVKAQNCKKVLVHYGSASAEKSGLLDRICKSLDEQKIGYVTLGGVVPNPRLSKVYEGIDLCRKNGVDFILAVGGGSVIDSAKAIGYGLANDGDVWDIYLKKTEPKGCTPVGAVLTIAAAGSEMSNSSVITNEDGWLKRGYNSEYARPKFAVLNPELTMTLPQYQTQSGATDILMHTLERYFSPGRENTELTDYIAEGLMKTVIRNALILMEKPLDYDARSEIMWAGSLSHNGLTGCGGTGDWTTHQMEHELGGMFDVTHGAGLAALWGSWARYVYKLHPSRFAKFARTVMMVQESSSDEETALAGIEALEKFFKAVGMPVTVSGMGITLTDEQIEQLAWNCSFGETRTTGSYPPVGRKEMADIYRLAR